MSETKIDKLTPEQEALIPVYQEKWRRIALSTEPIDREKAAKAVNFAYTAIGIKEPEIIFFDSPNAALRQLKIRPWSQRGFELFGEVRNQLELQQRYQLQKQLQNQLWHQLWDQFAPQEESQLYNIGRSIENAYRVSDSNWFDFCITVLNCVHNAIKWEALQLLVNNCGWIFPFEYVCGVCDRPRILSFDNQHRLHAEGTPAIQFADGYSLYSYHGVTLPEKYGKLHPHQWESQWLLEEENAELRRVLIQGIGYSRICQELEAIELDTWREYTLLRIDKNIDFEPMNMLKMTCPSTGHIHFLRVPPNLKSARKAIKWVNWGVDAEEFSVQT